MLGCSSSTPVKSVTINEENFPDPIWREVVMTVDEDADGVLSEAELLDVEEADLSYAEIYDLKGIEHFTNLKRLIIDLTQIETVDLSHFPLLEEFSADLSSLKAIDVSKNPNLKILNVAYSDVETLDVSMLKELEVLDVTSNDLTSLDLSQNLKLKEVYLGSCLYLSDLNLSQNTALEIIDLTISPIESFDVSPYPNLKYLDIKLSNIKSLDASMMSSEHEVNDVIIGGSRLISFKDAPNSNWLEELLQSDDLNPYKVQSNVLYFDEHNIDPNMIFDLEGAELNLEEGYMQVNQDNEVGYVTYKYYVSDVKDRYIECKLQFDPILF